MSPQKKRITIDLLRHGEPEGGEVLRGRIDHCLTGPGWQQMRSAIARASANTTADSNSNVSSNTDVSTNTNDRNNLAGWTQIISSPLQRCRAFAETVAQERGLPLKVETCWQEIDYGDWDGMPLPDWREQAAPMFQEFRQDMARLVPPNGEDFISFKDRVLAAWQQLSVLPDGSHVLLITHGGVLRVILPTVLGMPLNRSQPLHIPFASLSRVSLQVGESGTQESLIFHNTIP